MTSRVLVLGLAVSLGIVAGCSDTVTGGEGGSGGGDPGGDGGSTSSTLPVPGASTATGEPARPPAEICAGACQCDPDCAADPGPSVDACVQRFADDAEAAGLAGCGVQYDAYVACFSNEWTCTTTDACEDVSEALSTCIAGLCQQAATLCGWGGSGGACRDPWERCVAVCVVNVGDCLYDDAYYACTDQCYAGQYGSSGTGTPDDF
jgi:hypothetical protein